MKTIIPLIVSLMLFALIANAQSNQPSSEPSVSSKQKQHYSKKTDQKANYKQRGTEQFPIFIKPAPPITNDEIDYDAYEKREKPTIERRTMWATIILAVFTFLLWWATFNLAKDAQKTTVRQAIEMKRSLDIAKEAADAAKTSAGSLALIERAYVFIKIEDEFTLQHSQTISIPVLVHFDNYGRTPAIIHKANAGLLIDTNYPSDKHFDFIGTKIQKGVAINYGGFRENIKTVIDISPEEGKKIRRGLIKWICYGSVIYEDILKQERKTVFCWEYIPELGRFGVSPYEKLNYYT